MTITLELNSAVEGYLKTQASVQGVSVEAFVVTILETLMADATTQPLSPEKRAEAFVNWAKSHSFDAPPLSDEAISRESIYTREDGLALQLLGIYAKITFLEAGG